MKWTKIFGDIFKVLVIIVFVVAIIGSFGVKSGVPIGMAIVFAPLVWVLGILLGAIVDFIVDRNKSDRFGSTRRVGYIVLVGVAIFGGLKVSAWW